MSKTANKIISGITCVLYAWLYGAAAYLASDTFFWNSKTWSVERPFLSEKAEKVLSVFFLNNSDGEGKIINIFLAILAVLVIKTLVCALQQELSKGSKARILSVNFIYLLSVFLFVLFSGNKISGAIMAVICAVCLGFAFLVNVKTDDAGEKKPFRHGQANSILCVISAAVYIIFGIYFILINAQNSGVVKSDIFSDYYVIMFGILILYTLVRVVYLTAYKSLPSSYKVKALVGAGLVLPTSIFAMVDGGSMVMYFIRAVLFLAAIVFTLYTHFEFIIHKNDDNIEGTEINY